MNSRDASNTAHQQSAVGIDLGTTMSVIAYVDPTGRPVSVPNGSGGLLTPSAVLVDGDVMVVGKEAVRGSALTPDLYAECFKRDMGKPAYRRAIYNLPIPPEVLSAFVLEQLKKDAEQRLGPIQQAVITVPAFFDEARRRATQEAGRLAGLEVLDIINEPTAAALAFGYSRGLLGPQVDESAPPQRVLVYDLGGGTFDVTLLEISGNRFRALATDGDVLLGGKDFDERLVNCLAERFREAHGVDPRSNVQDGAQLWLEAQDAKHTLSERTKCTVFCFHGGIRMRIEITRTEFEQLTRDLLERTETTTSLVVKEQGLDWSQVDRILLVGGASRMPAVREMLRRLTGKEPDCSQSPDESVAHGAALYAAMLMAQGEAGGKKRCDLINVNSHSLGVVGLNSQTRERVAVALIPRNTPLPCRAVRTFHTARDNQRTVLARIVEGESNHPEECIALGDCRVHDLPQGLPQGTPVEVEFRYAANGRISVSARVARHSGHCEIRSHASQDLGDLATWRKRLLGQTSETPETIDLNDRASVLRGLDAMCLRLGKATVGLTLPSPLSRSQQAAAAAAEQRTRAQEQLNQWERTRQGEVDRCDLIRIDAALARARDELQRAITQHEFALLALGRECVTAGVCPSGLEQEFREVSRLQRHLEA